MSELSFHFSPLKWHEVKGNNHCSSRGHVVECIAVKLFKWKCVLFVENYLCSAKPTIYGRTVQVPFVKKSTHNFISKLIFELTWFSLRFFFTPKVEFLLWRSFPSSNCSLILLSVYFFISFLHIQYDANHVMLTMLVTSTHLKIAATKRNPIRWIRKRFILEISNKLIDSYGCWCKMFNNSITWLICNRNMISSNNKWPNIYPISDTFLLNCDVRHEM